MRWTDLPPDRGAADADASTLSRNEWQDLRQRLERLPPGHPSRPGDDGLADEDEPGVLAAEQDRPVESGPAGGRGVLDNEPSRRRGEPAGRPHHEAGNVPLAGARDPYRPWFTTGESPEPWFVAGSGG